MARIQRMARAAVVALAVAQLVVLAAGANLFDRPANAVCQAVSGLTFCSMVNYDAALAPGADVSAIDAQAQAYHAQLNKILRKYDCTNKYNAHSCDACRDAYRYWVCGMSFPACGPGSSAKFCEYGQECPPDARAKRLCASICEDVVRKCPHTVKFTCPTSDTIDYDGEITQCHKLDRTEWPPNSGQPWPGTFSAAPREAAVNVAAAAVITIALAASTALRLAW